MIWLRLLYLFFALFICSIGAGIGAARRIFAEPRLALAASVGIGGILLYLAAGAIYLSSVSWQWGFAITAVCAAGMALEWREVRRWWNDPSTRALLVGWVLLELWIVLANLEIRHFALWVGDWLEHYDRALFFLQHWAVSRQVYGPYAITARPPMMNLIEALFMGQVGKAFEFYQMAAGFLNATLYLAVAGLAIEWGGKRMGKLMAGLLALSPWFVQNATYPWTKLYCMFYVVLGVWFYHRALVSEDDAQTRRLKVLSLLMLAAGCLVHYSAAIVALFIAIHDLLHQGKQWRRILGAWILCALLLATWVGWALTTYGWHGVIGSTTTVYEAERNSTASLIKNLEENAAFAVVPRAILDPGSTMRIVHSNEWFWNKLRDVGFVLYEPGLLLAWGVGGLVAMGWALWNARRARGKMFWVGLVLSVYIGGLLVHTPPGYFLGGIAHVVLQPVVWIGLGWIAGRSGGTPRWIRRIWWWGIFIDMCWLVLHIGLEGRMLEYVARGSGYVVVDPRAASGTTLDNGLVQKIRGLRFLGMETLSWNGLVLFALACGVIIWWWSLRREFCRIKKGV